MTNFLHIFGILFAGFDLGLLLHVTSKFSDMERDINYIKQRLDKLQGVS